MSIIDKILGPSELKPITWMKYVTDTNTGCCTTAELLQASKQDAGLKETLKKWAIEEMNSKGIPNTTT